MRNRSNEKRKPQIDEYNKGNKGVASIEFVCFMEIGHFHVPPSYCTLSWSSPVPFLLDNQKNI